MDVSLKVARETLKSHIIGSPSDQFAVIFYGTVWGAHEPCALFVVPIPPSIDSWHRQLIGELILQEETKNAGAFPHVYNFQDLEQSTAMRIKEVDGLIGKELLPYIN